MAAEKFRCSVEAVVTELQGILTVLEKAGSHGSGAGGNWPHASEIVSG